MIEKRGNVWRVRVYWRGKYRCGDTFSRKKDATDWQAKQLRALTMGTWVSEATTDVTVADFAKKWALIRRPIKPSSLAREESTIRTLVLPKLGRRLLSQLSPSDIKEWANGIATGYSASSARKALGFLRQCYKAALADGIVSRDPTVGIKLPGVPRQEPSPLTHDQLLRLADALPPRDRLMVLVMGYGGLRWCEVVALRRSALTGNRLRLTTAAVEVNGHIHEGDLKTHEARTVVLPAEAVAADLTAWANSLPGDDPLLFASSDDTWIRYGNWCSRVLKPGLEKSKVPRITPHALRDTAASLAVENGASVASVAALLGHRDGSVSLKHYVGWWPDDLDNVAKLLDKQARRANENHQNH